MFPNHHYSPNYGQNQSHQAHSQAPSYSQLSASSSQSLQPHAYQVDSSGYPSTVYPRHQYGQTPSLSTESQRYDHRWSDEASTSAIRQAQPDRDQTGTYDAHRVQEAQSERARLESAYDTRGLGSLAYASGLEVAALSADRPVSTGTATYSLSATATSDTYRRDLPGPAPASAAGASPTSHQSLPATNSTSYASGYAYAQPSRSGHVLPSIHQGYSIPDMGNNASTISRADHRDLSDARSQRTEHGRRTSRDADAERRTSGPPAHRPHVAQPHQGYPSAQATSSIHQTRSNSLAAAVPYHTGNSAQQPPNRTVSSQSPYEAPPSSKTPDQQLHASLQTAQYGQPAQNGQAYSYGETTSLEPRTASPFPASQHQAHHSGASGLNHRTTPREHSGSGAVTNHVPTTVDPSQVYNPQHEYRRQAAAAEAKLSKQTARRTDDVSQPSVAEAKVSKQAARRAKKASEPTAADKPALAERQRSKGIQQPATANPAPDSRQSVTSTEPVAPHSGTATREVPLTSENADEEDMEMQVKIMLEKMRKYQAMDPSKFAKVLEEAKKAPPQMSTPTQPGFQASSETPTLSTVSVSSVKSPVTQPTDTTSMVSRPSPAQPQERLPTRPQAQKGTRRSAANAPSVSANAGPEQAIPNTTSTLERDAVPPTREAHPGQAAPAFSTSMSTLRPQRPRTGTIWPETKKVALAVAAVEMLMSAPENSGKTITTQCINDILDGNPSYVELCQILESMGFFLDRTKFAKSLLAAVPDEISPASQPSAQQSRDASVVSVPQAPSHATPQQAPPPSLGTQDPALPQTLATSVTNSTQKQRKSRPRNPTGRSVGRPRKDGTSAQPRPKAGRKQDTFSNPQPDPSLSQKLAKTTPGSVQPCNTTSKPTEHITQRKESRTPIHLPDQRLEAIGPQQVPVHKPAPSAPLPTPHRQSLPGTDNSANRKGHQAISRTALEPPRPPTMVQSGSQQASRSHVVDITPSVKSTSNPERRQKQIPQTGKSQAPPPPRTMSKAEASRKRTFAEIVDLTEDLSDYEMAWDLRDESPHISLDRTPSKKISQGLQRDGVPNGQQQSPGVAPFGIPPGEQITENPSTSTPRATTAMKSLPPGTKLVRSFRREDARRRSTYDSRTIARDVLIASGRHPTMAGLNQHLDILKKSFAEVSNTSDLTTFRWDIVDPGGSIPGTAKVIAADARSLPSESTRLPVENSSAAIASQSKTSRSVPARKASRSTNAVNGTGAAKAANPGGASALAQASKENVKASLTLSQKRPHEPQPKNDSRLLTSARPVQKKPRFFSTFASNSTTKMIPFLLSNSTNTIRSAHTSSVNALQVPSQRFPKNSPTRTMGLQPPKPASLNPPTKLVRNLAVVIDPGAFRRSASLLAEDSTDIHREALGPSPSPDTWGKIPMPVYRCRWQQCQAELHNVDVLRKHVMRVHGHQAVRRRFLCLWSGCSRILEATEENDTALRQPVALINLADWMEHVDKRHIEDYAWKYGDGPFAGRQVDDLSKNPPYFKDAKGRSTMPQPSTLLSENVRTAVGRGYLPNNGWFRAHGMRTIPEKAQAILDSISETQRRSDNSGQDIGAAVCAGGPRFVTETLRDSLETRYQTEIIRR